MVNLIPTPPSLPPHCMILTEVNSMSVTTQNTVGVQIKDTAVWHMKSVHWNNWFLWNIRVKYTLFLLTRPKVLSKVKHTLRVLTTSVRSVLATILLRVPPKLSQIWTKLQFIMFLHSITLIILKIIAADSAVLREGTVPCVCVTCRIRFFLRSNMCRYEPRDCSLDKNSWLWALKLT